MRWNQFHYVSIDTYELLSLLLILTKCPGHHGKLWVRQHSTFPRHMVTMNAMRGRQLTPFHPRLFGLQTDDSMATASVNINIEINTQEAYLVRPHYPNLCLNHYRQFFFVFSTSF